MSLQHDWFTFKMAEGLCFGKHFSPAFYRGVLQRTRSRKVRNINDMFFSEFWHLRFPFSDLTLASETNCSWANRWSVQKARHSDKYGRADQKYWNACSATRWTAKGNRSTILGKEPISWYPEQQRHLEVTASRNAERCQIIIKTKKEVTSDGWYRRRERRGNIILVYIYIVVFKIHAGVFRRGYKYKRY